jgi:hypothetical protein
VCVMDKGRKMWETLGCNEVEVKGRQIDSSDSCTNMGWAMQYWAALA